MEKLFAVCWGQSIYEREDDKVNAFSGLQGIYTSLATAQKALVNLKDEFYDKIINDLGDNEEEATKIKTTTYVNGSVEKGYFEIGSTSNKTLIEVYIQLAEKEIVDILL